MEYYNSDHLQILPASFRVIGVGTGIEEVIKKIKSLELDGVSAEIADHPYDCIPNDEDTLAIIVFTDLENEADKIANTFHDTGILTLGFSEDANPSCYDSVMLCDSRKEYPELIKDLLQTIVTPCLISFDIEDLRTILRDSKYFTVKSTSGNDIKDTTEKLGDIFNELKLNYVEHLSIHLYFNPDRSTPLAVSEMACLQQLMSKLPETVNMLWSVNHDENLNNDEIRLSAILAGKEVWKCQTT